MALWRELKKLFFRPELPAHLATGRAGEKAARLHLSKLGLKYLMANFSSRHGEVDLIFRDGECLVFVEVKTRSPDGWTRPERAVDQRKQRLLTRTALDYLRAIKNPEVSIRFDIVEVLVQEGETVEIRHIENAFPMTKPYRYG